MAEVFGPLGLGLASLNFVLTTLSNIVKAVDTFRERTPQLRAIELRLATCLDHFACWEDYWRSPQLEVHRELCLTAMEDVKSLAAAIKEQTKRVDMSEGQQRAWKKMKRAISQGVFYRPRSGMNYVGETVAYNLWNKGLLEDWISRLEKVVESINKLYERDYHVRTGEHYNDGLNRGLELLRLESFASKVYSKACGLHNACTAATGTHRWALAFQPPQAGEDVSRWDFQIPINIEMRFRSFQEQSMDDRFRLRVAYEDGISDEDTIAEALAEIGRITVNVNTKPTNKYATSQCHEQGQFSRETVPVSQLLEREHLLFESEGWKEGLPERIFGISQWSILLWNTPWVERFCCHGLTMEIDMDHVGRTRHIFESRQHGTCPTQQNISGLKRVGLVCAQLVMGLPIRPSSMDKGLEFEVEDNDTWWPISMRGINAELNKATGSQPLAEAISFCLGPGTESFDENFKFGYLHKLIDKMHNPIKNWYESQSSHTRKFKEIQARKMTKLPGVEKWAEEIMTPTVKDHIYEQEVLASGSGFPPNWSILQENDPNTTSKTTRKDSMLTPPTRRRNSSQGRRTRLSPIGEAWV